MISWEIYFIIVASDPSRDFKDLFDCLQFRLVNWITRFLVTKLNEVQKPNNIAIFANKSLFFWLNTMWRSRARLLLAETSCFGSRLKSGIIVVMLRCKLIVLIKSCFFEIGKPDFEMPNSPLQKVDLNNCIQIICDSW